MNVTLPDGTVVRDVPDNISKADLVAKLKANGYDTAKLEAPAERSLKDRIGSPSDMVAGLTNFVGKNELMGAVRGAAGIGATIMQPFQALEDKITGKGAPTLSSLVTGQKPMSSNEETRAGIDGGIQATGADPTSMGFQAGKLGTEIAGTMGAGGVLAAPLRGAAPGLANALASSGFTTGAAPTNLLAKAADLGVRTVGGAAAGGAQAGLVSPDHADTGAMIGGALPGTLKALGAAGGFVGGKVAEGAEAAAKRLMQSAIKPTIQQLKSGEAATAVQTLLDYGINPSMKGVEQLKMLVEKINADIGTAIGGSTARVDKQTVVNALAPTRQKFGAQVSPTSDLNAIEGVQNDFLAHPNAPGADMSVQAAQEMKKGTYRVLKGKYGQMGSAETEAQKGLARGLKEEIAAAVPEVGPLNAEESRLLTTLSVAERRALMELNKNPLGLASLASNPMGFAAFMADKSAAFKSLAARALNNASGVKPPMVNALAAPAAYRALPLAEN